MRTIYKYELSLTDDIQTINLPRGAHILRFGEQDGQVVMWVDVRTDNEKDLHTFLIVGTGHDITDYPSVYLDTVQMSNGLVWHIYERF